MYISITTTLIRVSFTIYIHTIPICMHPRRGKAALYVTDYTTIIRLRCYYYYYYSRAIKVSSVPVPGQSSQRVQIQLIHTYL